MMDLDVERDVTLVVNGKSYAAHATIEHDAMSGGGLLREDGSIEDGPASTKRREIDGSFKCDHTFEPLQNGVMGIDHQGEFVVKLYRDSHRFTGTLIEYWNGETASSLNS